MTRRSVPTLWLALVAFTFLPALPLDGQDTPETAVLAGALLRVEYALRDRPPSALERAEVNRAFDRATLAFFAGQVEAVVEAMDLLAARIEPDPSLRARHRTQADDVLAALPGRRRILGGEHAPIPYRLHGPGRDGSGHAGPGGDGSGQDGSGRDGSGHGGPTRDGPGGAPPEGGGYPVVVALHGAGGNEHMFLEAYGAGRLADLAEEIGFVVISPSTSALAAAPEGLAGLLDAAEAEFPIDRTRVHLLGHSMGAGAAWSLVTRDPGVARAVACLAGPCGAGVGRGGSGAPGGWPAVLVVGGALDPLAPPARLEAVAAQGREQGVDVELRIEENEGHTLLVGAVLDEVIAWLLARR